MNGKSISPINYGPWTIGQHAAPQSLQAVECPGMEDLCHHDHRLIEMLEAQTLLKVILGSLGF